MGFYNLCMWGDLEVKVTTLVLSWESSEPISLEHYEYLRGCLQWEDCECQLVGAPWWVWMHCERGPWARQVPHVVDGSHGGSDPNGWWVSDVHITGACEGRNTSPWVAVREFPAPLREGLLQPRQCWAFPKSDTEIWVYSGEDPSGKHEVDYRSWVFDMHLALHNFAEHQIRQAVYKSICGPTKRLIQCLGPSTMVHDNIARLDYQCGAVAGSDVLMQQFYQIMQNKIGNFATYVVMYGSAICSFILRV